MRKSVTILGSMALLFSGACRDTTEDVTNTEDVEVDIELLEQISAEWEVKGDLENLLFETVVDANGCTVPKWLYGSPYFYNPDTLEGEGMHMIDMSYPIDQYEENVPRIVMFEVGEDGTYELAGLEWYFEPPGQEPLPSPPTLFNGVPMNGMMEPHVEGLQRLHYDLHGWVYKTHPDNDYGYFGSFNPGMTPPSWYFEFEPVTFQAFQWYDPGIRDSLGYAMGDCYDGVGQTYTNPDKVGAMDPFGADTLFYDVNGIYIGSQWTVPAAEVAEAPVMFGQTMTGPDENDNYVLRAWLGARVNPDGVFAPAHRFVGCSEPQVPVECISLPF